MQKRSQPRSNLRQKDRKIIADGPERAALEPYARSKAHRTEIKPGYKYEIKKYAGRIAAERREP